MKPHYWSYCTMCDHAVVICGTCDNNCCNGGYGTVNDADCADCPSAYALYYKVAGYLQMTKSTITTAQAASLARDLCGVAMCLDEHEMLETGQLTLYKAAEMLINLLARAEAAEAERDDCADQIANLLPRVNREAVEQRKRAEAAEARVAELEESVVLGAAARDILAERARQISAEGWIPKHDDAHDKGEIASAAAAYAAASTFYHADPYAAVLSIWPWKRAWLKPTNPRRDLVKAGALILAEIERLDRAAALKGSTT